MSKVILEMSMSLDGFIAGPNIRPEEPMGDEGEKFHEWMFKGDKTNEESEAFYIHIAHMLLGDGARLFDKLTIQPTYLEEIAAANRPGVTHLKFHLRR